MFIYFADTKMATSMSPVSPQTLSDLSLSDVEISVSDISLSEKEKNTCEGEAML